MIILGTPVGKADFVRAHCVDIAKAGDRLCCEMLKLSNRQSSMLILHYCHVPRLNYLARQVFPCDLEEAGIIHDELTKRTFMSITGFSHLSGTAWKQTDRQTGRQIDRQTDKETDRRTDKQTDKEQTHNKYPLQTIS